MNAIGAQFSVARFYETVNDTDRLRLESEGKFLAFTSGSEGYFTDRETAQLIALGRQDIAPIFAGDTHSPHNRVAYGSLISSDGIASTSLSSARLLVIDDENRSHGPAPLLDRDEKPISAGELSFLYDRMGDGTMLVSDDTMRALQTSTEREQIAANAALKNGLSDDISALAQELTQMAASDAEIERRQLELAHRSVVQFRAASPDLPGIAKGTMASSHWCNRLGVDAIISVSDIKGADRRLLSPGFKNNVNNLFFTRKTKAEYSYQSVGPQVKYTIPEATQAELNPIIQGKAEKFSRVASNATSLSQHYVNQKEQEKARPSENLDDSDAQNQRPD